MAAEPREQMRCPTCGAEQVWADACRRCRCDLRMLRAAEQAYQLHRRRCLDGLRNGQIEIARRHAQINVPAPAGGRVVPAHGALRFAE